MTKELKPALSWGDALLMINEKDKRISELEHSLGFCASMAGNQKAQDACRLIIAEVKEALEGREKK